MKALHVILICLIIFAIFSHTAVALRPLIQQESDIIPKEKIALHKLLKVPPKGKPGLITLGDPIEDPIPNRH